MGISSSATFRVTSPGKKIVQTCLLNLVTPFLTLMLTLLRDLSISTNGLAILMLFFLAILLTTPQFAPPNWDESKNWFRSSRNVASNWQLFLAMTSKVTKVGLPTSRHTTSWIALITPLRPARPRAAVHRHVWFRRHAHMPRLPQRGRCHQ